MVYLKAPSGVGKTTLAKVVMGLYRAEKVAFALDGLRVTERTVESVWQRKVWGKRAGMVFQHADEALDLQATVREAFAGLPLRPPMKHGALRAHLGLLFENNVVEAILDKKAAHLSGGQKQRLNILRTLAMRTPLVILDEPLNGLDFGSVKKVLGVLEQKRRDGAALLMISHNEEIFDTIVGEENTYHLACSGENGA
jgi:ABC-type glutathione transport system ATPase component